jgi:hypothetical protein
MISSLLTFFLLVGPHSRAAFAGTHPFRVLCGTDGLGVNGQNQKELGYRSRDDGDYRALCGQGSPFVFLCVLCG